MSHRREQKAHARAEREAAERRRAAAAVRRRRLWAVGAIAAAALAAVVAIVVVSLGGDSGKRPAEPQPAASALFAGIPQKGTSLGDPKAPVVLTEFADLQCPFCRDYAVGALPTLVQRYVKTGRVRLELRLLRFIGPDSVRGARAAHAAARENRLWNFTDAFYRAQGTENTGYVTDGFLGDAAQAAGVAADPVVGAVRDSAFERQLQAAETEARTMGIQSTPSFLVSTDGRRPRPLKVQSLTVEGIEQALRPELAR